jgi:hypothetical protein
MPRPRKKPIRKQEPEKVSRKMANVRPARDQGSARKRYDPGYKPPPEKSPWQDEGYPES